MLRATFSGFTTAQLAMAASQRALDVTGQNMANSNTPGYTRQRLDLMSLNLNGGNYYSSSFSARVGNGVLVTGVSQMRDPYLDVQYRNQIANVGSSDAKDAILKGIADVFDETGKTSISSAFQDLEKQLSNLASGSGSDSMVRASMEVLVNLFRSQSIGIDELREAETNNFQDVTIKSLNDTLANIKELNDSIKSAQILGNPALELQDERNKLVDELATYLPITASYKDVEVAPGITVPTLHVSIKTADGSRIPLIEDGKIGEFAATTDSTKKLTTLTVKDSTGATHQLAGANAAGDVTNNLNAGVLKGTLDMLNSAGAFNGDLGAEKGLGYYEGSFDLLVNEFATRMNALNGANSPTHPDALFSTLDGSADFSAKNIKISDDWKNGNIELKKSLTPDAPSDDISNLNKFQEALKEKFDFNAPTTGHKLYNGDFYSFFTNMQGVLGIDQKSTATILKNNISVVNQTVQSKLSVSGVNLDEEGMNLMHYQQSYTAACRLMTTLDEALDTLINGTGRVGR